MSLSYEMVIGTRRRYHENKDICPGSILWQTDTLMVLRKELSFLSAAKSNSENSLTTWNLILNGFSFNLGILKDRLIFQKRIFFYDLYGILLYSTVDIYEILI